MAASPVKLPPGFQLEQPQQNSGINLPPGFQLEGQTTEQPGPVSRFLSNLWDQVNPVQNIKGMAQATSHPIDTLKNDADARKQIYDKAEEAFKKGDYVGGSAHLLYSLAPLIGPSLDKAGEQFKSGDVAGGAGASVGMGLNIAGPAAVGDIMPAVRGTASRGLLLGKTPAEAYQSALKPSTTLSEAERAGIVDTGLREGIPVSKVGLEKIADRIDNLNQTIKDTIAKDPNRPVNPAAAVKNIDALKNRFATQVNPTADVSAIDASRQEFLDQFRNTPGGAVRNMTAEQAQAMKQGTYRALGDKAYGELKGASIEAQKSLARGLKDELAVQFPELSGLNAQESKLLDLQPVLEKAVNRIGNHQLVGIGTPVTAGAVKAVSGSGTLGAVAGVLKAVLDDPMVKSRLAIALNKAGVPYNQAVSRVGRYAAALGQTTGQAVNAEQ